MILVLRILTRPHSPSALSFVRSGIASVQQPNPSRNQKKCIRARQKGVHAQGFFAPPPIDHTDSAASQRGRHCGMDARYGGFARLVFCGMIMRASFKIVLTLTQAGALCACVRVCWSPRLHHKTMQDAGAKYGQGRGDRGSTRMLGT